MSNVTGLHAYFNDMSWKLQTVDFANDLDMSDSYILLKYIVFILENMQMHAWFLNTNYKPHKMYECQMRGLCDCCRVRPRKPLQTSLSHRLQWKHLWIWYWLYVSKLIDIWMSSCLTLLLDVNQLFKIAWFDNNECIHSEQFGILKNFWRIY